MKNNGLDSWEFDFEWLRIRHYVKDCLEMPSLPDIKGILFLIGLQEFGNWIEKKSFTKEEKQDLMHVAVCALLERDGYYAFTGRDQDGWPHYKNIKPFTTKGTELQEKLLKEKIVDYFSDHQKETDLFIKRHPI